MSRKAQFPNEPLVYIILLNWHGADDTIGCLRSLANLDYENYRVIVVDNGSTDDSIARIGAAYPRQEIIENGRNLGFSGGCNVGIRRAIGSHADYVWLLNTDTTVDPQALRAMVSKAQSDERVGAVGSILYHMKEPKRVQAWGGGTVNMWTGRASHRLNKGNLDYVTGASALLRVATLEQVGLLDEGKFFMYWEDTDLSFRMKQAGWRLDAADDSKVFHKEAGSLGRRNPILIQYFNASAVSFFRKHSRFWVIPICIGVAGRAAKSIFRGEMNNSRSVLRATWRALFVEKSLG